MVKNLPSNARDMGSIPHAAGQLSLRASTTEPVCHNYRAHALWSPQATTRQKPASRNEQPVQHNERSRVPQLGPDTAKKKNKNKKNLW